MKTEYRMVTFHVASSQLFPAEVGAVRSLTLDFPGSAPELAEQMDGWEPVASNFSHKVRRPSLP